MVNKEHRKSPNGTRTKALRAESGEKLDRFVERSLASGAGRWQHRLAGGRPPPGFDRTKVDREKLNDERGVKPLPVSRSRDGAESGNAWPGRVRGSFCILAPEIIPR